MGATQSGPPGTERSLQCVSDYNPYNPSCPPPVETRCSDFGAGKGTLHTSDLLCWHTRVACDLD
eukprot:4115688-Amphidinium_carterae.2